MRSLDAGGEATAARRRVPSLHVITDDSVLAEDDWTVRAAAALVAGGRRLALHVRGPATSGVTLHRLAAELMPVARSAGAHLLVNDRIDVALALALDGVHLGRRSLPVAAARALLGARALIGASCHTRAEVLAARDEGADWAFLGTIFDTPTHPGSKGAGVDVLAAAASELEGFPVVGIGGFDEVRAREALAAGAHGVAVVRGVWSAADPAVAVEGFLEAIEMGRSER